MLRMGTDLLSACALLLQSGFEVLESLPARKMHRLGQQGTQPILRHVPGPRS
jgi:hypothetical protein